MPRIHILPDQVANQIAAGEVVERPASVIKELIENSIDAGATQLEVEFKKGGTTYMRVEDNGSGMSKDDALLALERHATSKIREAADLNRIVSMGFRGEALPSIASVCRLQLQTREEGSPEGTEALVDGGKLTHVRSCGMPPGTRITISRLFHTVPARRKFLKAIATESAHIVHTVRLHALAHPEVAFTLIDDGRLLFQSPVCERLQDRVAEIFGRQIASELLEVDVAEGDLRLRGLIARPGQSRASRHEMLVFVNNRPVESRTLGYALVESYYGHIPKGRYPIAFLFLSVKPDQVDVNVHPAKREIRFRNEAQVRGFTVRTILETLRRSVAATSAPMRRTRDGDGSAAALTPSSSPQPPPDASGATAASPSPVPHARERLIRSDGTASAKAPPVGPPKPAAAQVEGGKLPEQKGSRPPAQERGGPSKPPSFDQGWRYLGWAQASLAIFDTSAGVVLLDTRAAWERIWFERLLESYSNHAIESQSLLLPQPLEFDPVASVIVSDNAAFLEEYGLTVAPFGRNFFRIEAVPSWLPEGEAENYLRELVALMRQGSLSDKKRSLAHETLARHGARKAARGQKEPTPDELDALLQKLFSCSNPLADPDGRPTYIELARSELDRRFQRPR